MQIETSSLPVLLFPELLHFGLSLMASGLQHTVGLTIFNHAFKAGLFLSYGGLHGQWNFKDTSPVVKECFSCGYGGLVVLAAMQIKVPKPCTSQPGLRYAQLAICVVGRAKNLFSSQTTFKQCDALPPSEFTVVRICLCMGVGVFGFVGLQCTGFLSNP